jgi:hypothetical protein
MRLFLFVPKQKLAEEEDGEYVGVDRQLAMQAEGRRRRSARMTRQKKSSICVRVLKGCQVERM